MPDDTQVIDAIQAHGQTHAQIQPMLTPSLTPDQESFKPTSLSTSWKLAIISALWQNDSLNSITQLSQRPTHRTHLSVNSAMQGPGLLPKEYFSCNLSMEVRQTGRVVLKRHSTNTTGTQHSSIEDFL